MATRVKTFYGSSATMLTAINHAEHAANLFLANEPHGDVLSVQAQTIGYTTDESWASHIITVAYEHAIDTVTVDAEELQQLRDTACDFPGLIADNDRLTEKVADLRGVIEDLKADIEKWKASANKAADMYGKATAERDALHTELTAAQQRIADLEQASPFKPGDVVRPFWTPDNSNNHETVIEPLPAVLVRGQNGLSHQRLVSELVLICRGEVH